jgi:hypothetical protein
MNEKPLFADPKEVDNLKDCYFYHTVDLPGYGTVHGSWDLRGGITEYFGGVDFKGKKVLEIGTANGALCFEMEKAGASVIAFDLSKDDNWDAVPHPLKKAGETVESKKQWTEKLNNAFWLGHRLLHSKAKVIYGDIYHIPVEIGPVDIVTFGAILLHVRDPFSALQTGLAFARETVIITDLLGNDETIKHNKEPLIKFLPDPKNENRFDTWWQFYPQALINMIAVLGFGEAKVNYHTQKFGNYKMNMYTVVGRRTDGEYIREKA